MTVPKLILVASLAVLHACTVLALPQQGIKTHHNLQAPVNMTADFTQLLQAANQRQGNWTFESPRLAFINRTRGEIQDGVCIKEVP